MKNKSIDAKEKYEAAATGNPVPSVVSNGHEVNSAAICTGQTITRLYVDCLPEISRHLYTGDGLLHIDETTPPDELMSLGTELYNAGPDAVLPGLKKQIEALLGDGGFHFEGWVIGSYSLSFYWLVRTEAYSKTVRPLNWWLKDNDIEDLVTFYTEALEKDEYQFITGTINLKK